MEYKAYYVEENDGVFSSSIKELEIPEPNDGELLVSVSYSSLNYKDALCAKGVKGVAAFYPFVPGIDAVGTVAKSKSDEFKEGDKVICSGYKLGMNVNGGFGSCICVPSDWVVPLPTSMSDFEAMSYGVAGLTSAACIKSILDIGVVETLPMAVSGVTGGVGSVAVVILSNLGYEVAAVTGKKSSKDYLLSLGAKKLVDRSELHEVIKRPLESAAWGACVDTVGGDTLSRLLGQLKYGASVAVVGNAGGNNISASAIPFMLRGINMLGIDSAMQPFENRVKIWDRLNKDFPKKFFEPITKVISLSDLPNIGKDILEGKIKGRVIVDVNI